MTNESHLFSWCNNPWYRELIAAHLTPVILSLFRLWLVLPSSPRCLWLVTITLLSLSLVTMADKESRIFEGAIDQKLNSIANIPSAISDLIFGDESIFLMTNFWVFHHLRSQVTAKPRGGARLISPPVSGSPGGGNHHGRRGQCLPRVSLYHQVSYTITQG